MQLPLFSCYRSRKIDRRGERAIRSWDVDRNGVRCLRRWREDVPRERTST
jgi:hypothetical protein